MYPSSDSELSMALDIATPPQPFPSSPVGSSLSQSPATRQLPFCDPSLPFDSILDDDGGGEIEADGMSTELVNFAKRKLEQFIEFLRDAGWSFQRFLRVWAGEYKSSKSIELDHRLYHTTQQRRQQISSFAEYLRPRDQSRDQLVDEIVDEVQELHRADPLFGRWDPKGDIESIDYGHGIATIKRRAPGWYALMIRLLSNQRAHRKSYTANTDVALKGLNNRLLWITSMVCYSRARETSNLLPALLTTYLMSSGLKRRCISLLSGLGITYSYDRGNDMLGMVAAEARRTLQDLAHDPQMVVVYDNINFKDAKRDEIVGHKSVATTAMTTAVLLRSTGLPPSGLTQSMHNSTHRLDLDDLLLSPGISGEDGHIGRTITTALIAGAVKRLHPESVGRVFPNGENYPSMPTVQVLPTSKTSFWQFGAIYEDEGTTEGHYGVHDSIFLRQLGLKASDSDNQSDDFSNRLWLVHGDQLTARRIRSVKAEQAKACRSYDRRDWMLGVPSWFHIQMNLLHTIVRTHWSPDKAHCTAANHCLKADITTWNRSCTSKASIKYHQVEPVLRDGFVSRVCALFYNAMRRRGCMEDTVFEGSDAADKVAEKIGSLTQEQFHELVEDVRIAAFTLTAWRDGSDIEYRTMCRMLQETELFLTVRHAVKYADVGLLRYVVDPLIPLFFGAGQANYGHEMLFYRWNLLSNVNTPELQHAILASGLVNWSGLHNSYKPIDLGLEHLNGSAKIEMKCYKNSTHDANITFNRVCLSNTWVRALRTSLEEAFGERMPGKHTVASTQLDIFVLARKLYMDGLVERRVRAPGDAFDSPDIRFGGMRVLSAKVDAFNRQLTKCKNGLMEASQDAGHGEEERFDDISAFVATEEAE